jgi:hypothetical protein
MQWNYLRQVTVAIALSLLPTVASAYFDPGTGSLLIQAAVGGLAAIAVFWGNVKAFARNFLSKRKAEPAPSAVNEDGSTDNSKDSE